ncbi:prohead protease/major capsid protein fusion protein [uncultured Sphingomonas sp.]|uniref:prohead protease/major capsid protein fusion protein n=1 Tax=uncultured Sphingomonas sp. TaxID=158754 RepID=UPI00258D26F0|nr:prohead protease/major capsid protein fusion protein [uncultured Sphingomonas sp.]
MTLNRHRSLNVAAVAERRNGFSIGHELNRLFASKPIAADPHPAQHERKVSAPIGNRALALQPASWNAEARTVDVVWTTGSRGVRFDFDTLGLVDEELATGAGNVRLERLNAGAPVLNAHQRHDLSAQIGTIVPGSARMQGGQGIATLKLSDRPEVASIVADIAAGIIRNLSVGYTVHVFEADMKATPRPLYRAIDWEPTEISFVPVPFDAGAQVRDMPTNFTAPCLIRNIARQESNMNTSWLSRFTRACQGMPAASQFTPPPAAGGGNDTDAQSPPSYERQATVAWLRSYANLARDSFDLPADVCNELALELAERQLTEGDARDAIMHIVTERQRHQMRGVGGIGGGGGAAVASPAGNALIFGARTFDNPQFHAQAVEDALFARMSGSAPSEQARQFMGMSMVQIAGELLTRSGVHNVNRMAPNDLLSAAGWNSGGTRSYMHQRDSGMGYHTTSDFPQLLLGAGERFLMQVFAIAASPLKQISRQRSARDFRTISGLELSGFGTLVEVPESGEIKHGSFRERKETYRLRTFAKQFGLSRQAIINDDLGAFADPMVIMARAAAETEASLFAELLNSNPVMADGIPMFDERHGNVAAVGSLPTILSLTAGRTAMRQQKGLDGTPIAPSPKYIVSGVEQETVIEQLMTAVQATNAGETNPFAGKLTPAADPRLPARAWYLFGDPAIAPTLEHAYLNDQTGPIVEQQDGWDVLGTKFRVYMDFGAGAVDWRGAYKNPGAALP